jgi:hypothetical protein
MKLKRATFTLVSASIVVTAGLVVLPTTASAASPWSHSSNSLWVNQSATVSGHHNSCTTPGYTTVSAAIAAAPSGATIHVCPATDQAPYVEQLTITKPLNLVAAGSGVTIELPAAPAIADTSCDTATGAGPDQDEISICTPGTVTISGITVEALWPGDTCNDNLYGILVGDTADLKMSDSTMDGAGANPINGCQGGVGIEVGMSWTTPVEVGHATLKDVTVDNYQKNGITIDGTGSTATITGTTVTGAGPTTQTAQNGIQVSYGAEAAIKDSTVTGNECDLTGGNIPCGSDSMNDYQAAGILFYGSAPGSSVTDSSVGDSDIGVYAFDENAAAPVTANVTVSHDTLNGDRYEGLVLDQGFTSVTNDTISNGNVGIQVMQYNGQTYGVKALVKDVTVSGMSVAAAQVYSDEAATGDDIGSLSITGSKISGNPGSITGSVLDNSPAYGAYAVTLKKDT